MCPVCVAATAGAIVGTRLAAAVSPPSSWAGSVAESRHSRPRYSAASASSSSHLERFQQEHCLAALIAQQNVAAVLLDQPIALYGLQD